MDREAKERAEVDLSQVRFTERTSVWLVHDKMGAHIYEFSQSMVEQVEDMAGWLTRWHLDETGRHAKEVRCAHV